jgi:hypothetical protein
VEYVLARADTTRGDSEAERAADANRFLDLARRGKVPRREGWEVVAAVVAEGRVGSKRPLAYLRAWLADRFDLDADVRRDGEKLLQQRHAEEQKREASRRLQEAEARRREAEKQQEPERRRLAAEEEARDRAWIAALPAEELAALDRLAGLDQPAVPSNPRHRRPRQPTREPDRSDECYLLRRRVAMCALGGQMPSLALAAQERREAAAAAEAEARRKQPVRAAAPQAPRKPTAEELRVAVEHAAAQKRRLVEWIATRKAAPQAATAMATA